MAEMSKKIKFYDKEKLDRVNPETIKLWNKYKIDMTLRELSPGTIDGYYNDIVHLWIYTLDNFDNICVKELGEDELTEFFYFCKMQGNNSRRIKRRMSSIAAFFQFLRKRRIILENPMEFIDRPNKDTDIITQTFLSQEQVDEIISKLQTECDESKSVVRHHAALSHLCYALFSLSTMARVNAISNTRWEQINFENRIVEDVLEKEGKVVTLYFSEEVKKKLLELQAYRSKADIVDNGFVFVTRDGGAYNRATTGTLNQWCKKIGALIGIPTLHPHDFRHSASQLMKLAGADIQDISSLLNHGGTDVTIKHYLRTDTNKVREVRDQFGI